MKKKSIITLVLLLAIGFAAVSTTLVLNGTIGIGTNDNNFVDGVVFDETSLSSSEGTTAEISESGRTITFTTQEMKSIDETAIVNFKIKNYSQYDAILGTPAISCYFVDEYQEDTVATKKSDTHEYMTVTPGTELDGKTITAGGGLSDESSITVKQKKSYAGEGTQTVKFQCVINATAGESSTAGIEKPTSTGTYELIADTNNNGVADVGEEIAIGEEHFYVISNDGSTLNALAKYNLYLGNIYKPDGTLESTISSSEEGYGIQNGNARGYVDGADKYIGTVAFSNNNGWDNTNNATINIKDYEGPVRDALYGDNGYEKYIQKTIPKATVRLIEKSELEALGCSSADYTCTGSEVPTWVYSTSYWTQSAYSDRNDYVWSILSSGGFGDIYYDYDHYSGVRPVVEIPLT